MPGCIHVWMMDGWTDGQKINKLMDSCMNGWMDGWTEE